MSTSKRKVRLRWRRIITWVILAYMLYWCGVSVHHIIAIRHQESTLQTQITQVKAQNRTLSGDIRQLHNPSDLKKILTGQAPLPTLTSQP